MNREGTDPMRGSEMLKTINPERREAESGFYDNPFRRTTAGGNILRFISSVTRHGRLHTLSTAETSSETALRSNRSPVMLFGASSTGISFTSSIAEARIALTFPRMEATTSAVALTVVRLAEQALHQQQVTKSYADEKDLTGFLCNLVNSGDNTVEDRIQSLGLPRVDPEGNRSVKVTYRGPVGDEIDV